jgi:integrase
VYLAPQALDLVRSIRAGALEGSIHVFPGIRRGRPVVNPSKWIAEIKKKTGINVRPHDLRRTATTLMTSNGVPQETVSRILNHTLPGVTGRVYDLYKYDKEKNRG